MYREIFERIVEALPQACLEIYGERLKSAALFGSVARGTMRPDSDIDLFLVIDPLPEDLTARRREFERVEERISDLLSEARRTGVQTFLAPVIKTPAEMRLGSFLHLDLTDQARILYDPRNVLRDYLDDLAARLKAMGAKRVYKGGGYYWVLKPDYKWGDRIEL
jgi:predicted nucleotidyltransferase